MNLLSCLQWLSPTLHSCLVPVEFEFASPVTISPSPMRSWRETSRYSGNLPWKSTRGHRVHQNQLLLSPCCFCEAMLPPRNSERSLLMLLLVAHPPWEPQPWLLREMLHTPKGDKDSLLSVRKLFQSHTLSKPRFSPALLWAVVCGGNASCTETFL